MAQRSHSNMAKDQEQLNLTVVALVALVAIVGLVALVLNTASVAEIATGSQMAEASPDDGENLAGEATCITCKTLPSGEEICINTCR